MSGWEWVTLSVGFAGCLGLSFFLSGMEAGLDALSRLRLRRKARDGNENAVRLQRYLDQPEDTLWTILVGNTLAILLALLTSLFLLQYMMGIESAGELVQFNGAAVTFWLLFLFFALLFFTLCELLPKTLFRKYPDQLCLALVRLFGVANLAFNPLVSLLRSVSRFILFITGGRELQDHLFGSREELHQMMTDSGQGLTKDERAMIDRVLDLQKIPVRDLSIPLENMPDINTETPLGDLMGDHAVQAFTRLPVWREANGRRRIVGVVNLRRLIFLPEEDWRRPVGDFLESALYQDEDVPLQKLLSLMQRSGQRVVIILNKRKRELGIVSLPDILRNIFGEVKG